MKEPRRVEVEQCLYYVMNVRIVCHSYSDVAWTAGETASPPKNANEPAVTIHDRVAPEWVMQAQAVVEMSLSFELALAEKHKDSVGWLYYYLGEHPVAGNEELSEWVQLVVGLYVHDVVVAMIAPVEDSNQSAAPHPMAY
jgi:hypothetical protein